MLFVVLIRVLLGQVALDLFLIGILIAFGRTALVLLFLLPIYFLRWTAY